MLTALVLGTLLLQGPKPGGDVAPPESQQTKAEIQHQKDLDNDVKVGKEYAKEVEKTEKLSDNKAYQERVNRIGQELAEIARTTQVETLWGDKRLNKFDYTFKVLKGEDVNAFSLPGGFIYVYEGLIKYAESDDEIAAVLAHEISHAEERHIAQLTRDQQKVQTPALIAILAAIVSKNPEFIEGAIIVGSNTVQAFTSAWSVRAEEAADHGGFQYLLKSKYNPTAMLTFMERLAQDEHSDMQKSGVDWGIYQTHPLGKDRAEAVLKDMRRWNIPVQRSAVTTRYRTEVKPGKDGVDIWFNRQKLYTFGGSDALTRADAAALRLNTFFDSAPNLFDLDFDGKNILGRRNMLFEVLPEDAELEKTTVDDLGEDALRTMKGTLYNYGFNVWTK